ncbi:MAG: carotenoid biosynthesis protein [Bacteroidota bacterium]|nr:carotenoid biosynthesis protein [Bacteroidota bacterium]
MTKKTRSASVADNFSSIRIIILIVLHLVGVFGFLIDSLHPYFIQIIPYHLIFISFILFFEKSTLEPMFWLFFVFAYLIGYGAEVFGVKSGIIFGYYSYTDVLGFKIADVPVVIGLLWASVSYACNVLAIHLFPQSKVSSIICAALLMVSFDFMLEPFAVSQGLWIWQMNEVPLFNYISWFALGVIISSIFHYCIYNVKNEVAPYFLLTQFLFFIAQRLVVTNWGFFN